jgi:hypothetical protein
VTFVKIGIDGGPTFLSGVYRQTVRLSESEESLQKVCELRHGVHNSPSCYVSSRSAQFAIFSCIMWVKFVIKINAIYIYIYIYIYI